MATRKRPKLGRTFAVSGSDALLVHVGHRLLNPLNTNIHFGEKRRMKERFMRAVAGVDRPVAVRTLTFVRWFPPRSKVFDGDDNLNASFKWFRDAACEWLGLPDDGPGCGVAFKYEQCVSDSWGITVRFQ